MYILLTRAASMPHVSAWLACKRGSRVAPPAGCRSSHLFVVSGAGLLCAASTWPRTGVSSANGRRCAAAGGASHAAAEAAARFAAESGRRRAAEEDFPQGHAVSPDLESACVPSCKWHAPAGRPEDGVRTPISRAHHRGRTIPTDSVHLPKSNQS